MHDIHLTTYTVSVILSFIIPVLTSAVSHSDAPAKIKGNIALVLSAAAGLISAAVSSDGTAIISQTAFQAAALAWAIQTAAYNNIYKPRGLNKKVLPDVGLGKPK